LDNRGDVRFFESLQEAENYVEAIDVVNNEYVGYDSEGRILSLAVKPGSTGILGQLGIRRNRVAITIDEQRPSHADELRTLLVSFLRRVGVAQQWLNSASLDELVRKGIELQRG
jgi:hypothetical protein